MGTRTKTTYVIRIDGKQVDSENAAVNIFDHGFLYGDSIYEVVRTIGDKILSWESHVERLRKSAARLSLELPWSDDELYSEVSEAIGSGSWDGDTFIRLIITRGIGQLEQSPVSCGTPGLIIIAKELPEIPDEIKKVGLKVCLTTVRRNSKEAMDPGIKSGNYLNNVMAVIEAEKMGADDAVMLNEKGHLTECSSSNIYLIRDGVIHTPHLDCGLLAGVTRKIIIAALPEHGFEFHEGIYTVVDMRSADEMFVSSSVRGVVPIRSICGELEWESRQTGIVHRITELYEKTTGIKTS